MLVRTVIEMVGKPKEHIVKTLKDYVTKIKESYDVKKEHVEEPVPTEEQKELFSTFAEIEMETTEEKLLGFCFDYMPSSVEIIEPEEIKLKSRDLSNLLNDIQAKLHEIDLFAKNLYNENQAYNKTVNNLVRNIVMITLTKKSLSLEQLSKFTGVKTDNLKKFLDKMIEEEKITEKDGVYSLRKNE